MSSTGLGIGFIELLTLLFVAGKIFGFLDWSWWWVLSPLWISALVGLVIVIIILIIVAIIAWRE